MVFPVERGTAVVGFERGAFECRAYGSSSREYASASSSTGAAGNGSTPRFMGTGPRRAAEKSARPRSRLLAPDIQLLFSWEALDVGVRARDSCHVG